MTAAQKLGTYQDVLDAPEHLVAELVRGVLYTSPRPSPRHTRAAGRVLSGLDEPFDSGRDGPGGWLLLIEPELHLSADILVPDVAGWRRERMPGLPEAAYFDVAPDWICEVLSPGTARFDRAVKLPLYAAAGVSFAWLIDPLAQTLEVYERNSRPGGARWLLLETYGGDEQIRPVPFDALPFQLGDLWAQ